ncbi:hypothetical protein EDB83DRAFT_2521895 [Lactarius deliciosus]|nr:hypothetical protein EDB83DRAFT_2521895 [Lactarius deliciosus]
MSCISNLKQSVICVSIRAAKSSLLLLQVPPSYLTTVYFVTVTNIKTHLGDILSNINVDDEDIIEELGAHEQVADLGLSYDQILLVQLPVMHFIHIVSVNAMSWDPLKEGNQTPFKESDTNWFFFYAIAHHIKSLPLSVENDGTNKITVKLGQDSWPFQITVQVRRKKENHTYKPRSDFLILKFGLLQVAVEVNSNRLNKPATDLYRLLLQGASIVRLANTLDAYKDKSFVFVAIYISATGLVDRYLLYQKRDSRTIYRKGQKFDLSMKDSHVLFTLELYNLISVLDAEPEDEGTKQSIHNLTVDLGRLGEDDKLPTFNGKTKDCTSHYGGDHAGPSTHSGGGGTEQLKAHGYEIVPDVIETDGGTWELIDKLPPHICTVYRRSDPNKTEVIAKCVALGPS